MACVHADLEDLQPPSRNQSVYREDCTQCFDSIDSVSGLNVCLHCFNGGCTGEQDHAALHSRRFTHPLALNIKRTRKQLQRDEPPFKISKLAINPETEEDRYNVITTVVCYNCNTNDVDMRSPRLSGVVDGLIKAPTFSRKEEVKAWEHELTPCEHTLCLQQDPAGERMPTVISQCSECSLQENLWLCLECGNIGCGRVQFGGSGGNSHGLAHSERTAHKVAVKLRSITPEGSADIFCYQCNDEKTDPDLSKHLAHWGINIAEQEKTEKSLTEMQIEQNLKWEFSMNSSDGQVLKPVFGPGLTGLRNLGNSCYLASVLQCLFSLPEFKLRYFMPGEEPPLTPLPAEDLETQLRKISDGLHSGRYSTPDDTTAPASSLDIAHQRGLSPSMLKHLIGRGHEEFSTMRQQDSFELLLHLFKLISVSKHPRNVPNPVESFRFALEQRLQCLSCNKVRYKVDEQDNISVPVPARRLSSSNDLTSGDFQPQQIQKSDQFERISLQECLDIFTGEEVVELSCPGCGSRKGFHKRSLFKTFPKNLVINARRFELVNWVPTKLNIPVEVGNETLDMTPYFSSGPQEGEEILEDEPPGGGSLFVPNSEAFGMLLGMGFPEDRVRKALYTTGNADTDAALNWLLEHMPGSDGDEVTDIHETSYSAPPDSKENDAKISQLGEMGISAEKARKALKETGGDVYRAVDWVFSHPDDNGLETHDGDSSANEASATLPGSSEVPARFQLHSIICHKGASVHTGHYVAFIRQQLTSETQPRWILFNDEKVVEGGDAEEMKEFAYIYFFQKL